MTPNSSFLLTIAIVAFFIIVLLTIGIFIYLATRLESYPDRGMVRCGKHKCWYYPELFCSKCMQDNSEYFNE